MRVLVRILEIKSENDTYVRIEKDFNKKAFLVHVDVKSAEIVRGI